MKDWQKWLTFAILTVLAALFAGCETGKTVEPKGLATAAAGATVPEMTPHDGNEDSALSEAESATVEEVKSDKQRLAAEAPAQDMDELVAGNSVFAFELYQALRSGNDNLFFSPYSISLALAMTYGGARGETETQMAEVLHYSLPQGRLHPAFNDLDRTLAEYGHYYDGLELKIANAIWSQDGYTFKDAYLDLLAENYGAGLYTLDFVNAPRAAQDTINNWVREQTEGKITDLVGMPDSLTRLLLTNTIYFDAKWAVSFDLFYTHDDIFRLLDGSKTNVPMMEQERHFPYTEGDGYQTIALRYKGSGPIRMIFVLPEEGRFKEIEASFTADYIDGIIEDLDTQLVDLTLPRFEFKSELNLRDILARLGMPDAFNMGEADFSGMLDEQNETERALYIGDVIHKAFVDVYEEGTEAAAATAVEMVEDASVRMATPEVPIIMKLDRPFLFLIREPNGTILFAGRVLNPEG